MSGVLEEFNRIDILINNAVTHCRATPVDFDPLVNLTNICFHMKSGGNAVSVKMGQNLNRSSPV